MATSAQPSVGSQLLREKLLGSSLVHASSGVKIDSSVEEAYKDMKTNRTCSSLVFKISDDKTVIKVDRVGALGESFEDFKSYLVGVAKGKDGKCKDARYAVYDVFEEEDSGKNKLGKLLFILWSDDEVGIKQKMLYTSSVQPLKKKLVGAKDMECHSEEELTLEAFREKCKK